MILRMYAKDPDFETVSFLVVYFAALTNAHMHQDLAQMPKAERLAEMAVVRDWLEELAH